MGRRTVALSLAVVLGACANVAGVTGDYYVARDDSGTGGAAGATGTCSSERPPDPPSSKDLGGDLEIVLALRDVNFHETSEADWKSVGFDLDKTCTCQGEGFSCKPPATDADAGTDFQCDGPGGRDNNLSGLIAASATAGLSSTTFSQQIADGEWSVLFRIRGYNGLPDDDQVSVAWLSTLGLMKVPLWDGTDTWPIKGSSLAHDSQGNPDLDNPLSWDDLAYVTGGRLVASLKGEAAAIDIATGLSIRLQHVVFVATLVQNGDKWSAHGVVGGIWSVSDILKNLRYITPLGGQPLCTDNNYYDAIKGLICQRRDISPSSGLPSDPCDAISVGFEVTAGPAQVGLALDVPGPTNPCSPATDPANDSCG